ncbi:HNH endonuclease [Enhydrobacter aerosaccus]|uniref:HNH endonuclease n=1 Tax=Enhydrobacter aerosaccus TaxID=225324 RepID=A0A1T4S9U6_9HYPH|nr:DUF262 domain-containing protein [Enhydrobacter aerosaccus]SKA24668.1 HNH endonuclease [Enhydrobacter aerosaccus]
MFNPKPLYEIVQETLPIRDFRDYWEEFVVRPPYQRKSVWSKKKKQDLLDSLFRRYYVPRIVIREVRRDETRTAREVIDGQQRITTAKEFLDDAIELPKSLTDIDATLPGKKYSELPPDLRRFVDRELKYNADIVKGIDDPRNRAHQKIAAEIFWRLQQGESLTYMEIAHARLASLSRNFVVKYADEIGFDFAAYEPVDSNPSKHPFFSVIDRGNDRMQHLALLTRLLIFEEKDGPADVRESDVMEYIDKHQRDDGIGNDTFENEPTAREVLKVMRAFYDVFKEDTMIANGEGAVKELRTEYFIISIYLLLRHLLKYYVWDRPERAAFLSFTHDFHQRWSDEKADDVDIQTFSNRRQQTAREIEVRHQIIRQIFFQYLSAKGLSLKTKDDRRAFSEAERILIYRHDNGRCQACISEQKPDKECIVPWLEYDADHVVPHSRGGQTVISNAQVLCRYHNQSKGATIPSAASN